MGICSSTLWFLAENCKIKAIWNARKRRAFINNPLLHSMFEVLPVSRTTLKGSRVLLRCQLTRHTVGEGLRLAVLPQPTLTGPYPAPPGVGAGHTAALWAPWPPPEHHSPHLDTAPTLSPAVKCPHTSVWAWCRHHSPAASTGVPTLPCAPLSRGGGHDKHHWYSHRYNFIYFILFFYGLGSCRPIEL